VTYRLKAEIYHKIQATSELTKESATKIVETLVDEFCGEFLKKNEENKLQSARLQAELAQRSLDIAQAQIEEYEQINA
jgi:hypothetical protein